MTLPVEYRDISGHEGYRVGNDGTVWSLRRQGRAKAKIGTVWKQLVPRRTGLVGHLAVFLTRKRQVTIHTLVLTAFVGPRPEGMEALHADGNGGNNRLENLRWGTRKENCADTVRHGRTNRGTRSPMAKLNDEKVRAIRNEYFPGGGFIAIAKKYGVSPTSIFNIVTRRRWSHVV